MGYRVSIPKMRCWTWILLSQEHYFLRDFDEKYRDYVPGYASNCTCQYTSVTDFALNIFINEKTFIVHINGSAAYFIGNLRNDTVYLYDHNRSTHFRYRITAYIEDSKKGEKPKANVMYGEDEDWMRGIGVTQDTYW